MLTACASPPSPCPDAAQQQTAARLLALGRPFPQRRGRVPTAARSSSRGRRGRVPPAFRQPSRRVPVPRFGTTFPGTRIAASTRDPGDSIAYALGVLQQTVGVGALAPPWSPQLVVRRPGRRRRWQIVVHQTLPAVLRFNAFSALHHMSVYDTSQWQWALCMAAIKPPLN